MGEGKYDIDTILAWDLGPVQEALDTLMSRSRSLDGVATSTTNDFHRTAEFWNGNSGNAARNLSGMHGSDLKRSATVAEDIAEAGTNARHELAGERSALRTVVEQVRASEFQLFYTQAGKVRSRRSNSEWIDIWGPAAVVKLPKKEADEHDFTSELTKRRARIEEIDQSAAERLKLCLEDLAAGVKEGVQTIPADPSLAEILKKYQIPASKHGGELWPSGKLLQIIRQFFPDMKSQFMTREEASLLSGLFASAGPDIARGVQNIYDFYKIKSQAESAAQEWDNKNDPTSPSDSDGHADAYRHAYWNALMTRRFGEDFTKKFATAHEGIAGNPPHRESMDLFNNEVGRAVATAHPHADPDQLAGLIATAVHNGDVLVIGKDMQIHRSNDLPQSGIGTPPPTAIPMPDSGGSN